MHQIIMTAQPVTARSNAKLLLTAGNATETYELRKGQAVTIVPDYGAKYCTGWYDIDTHVNHPCDKRALITDKYDSCFACRKRTDFNPAFYNTNAISKKQADYNSQPHTVYVAHFGNGLAKAGIMSDSRGLDRLFEQGALLYAIIQHCPNATVAHNVEQRLIENGLKNSITKSQKQRVLQNGYNEPKEHEAFSKLLSEMKLNISVQTNMPTFLFNQAPPSTIEPIADNPISGKVYGIVGRYLILNNGGYYYGTWLNDLFGLSVSIDNQIIPITHAPVQASLF